MSIVFGLVSKNDQPLTSGVMSTALDAARWKNRRKIRSVSEKQFLFGYFDFGEPDRILRSEDGRFVVMMGGEAFGRKAALKKIGCTDAPGYHERPVAFLWHLYRTYGPESFRWLDGHFCLICFDTHTQRFSIIKDPVGQHPLYYIRHQDFFAFSSEYQILTALPGWTSQINAQSLTEFFAYGMILDGRTPLQDLKSIPYAGVLEWETGHRIQSTRYEEWNYPSDPSLSLEESTDLVFADMRERFLEKIEDGKIRELPLSGGFDTRFMLALLPPSVRKNFTYYTNCSPYLAADEDKDVIVASLVTERLGLSLEIRKQEPENTEIKDGTHFYEIIRPEREYTNINGHFSFLAKGKPIDHFSGTFEEFDRKFLSSLGFYASGKMNQWAMGEFVRYKDRIAGLSSGNNEWLHLFLNAGQCFMNNYQAINGGKWVNPVVFFEQNLRSPFQDASLLRNLLRVPERHLHNGNLFLSMYARHAPELLEIPFVRVYFPKENRFHHLMKELEYGTLYQSKRKRIWRHLFQQYLFSGESWRRGLYGWRFRLALLIKWLLEYQLEDVAILEPVCNHWRYKKIIPPMIDQTFVRMEAWLRTYQPDATVNTGK